MKFSVVTISFNQAEFLERTIQSVISQEGVDLEYIIVDPGSTDGSRDIIERYRSHFAHVVYDKDNGPADGLNKGLALASGDWFGYLNSDDCYLPGGLKRIETAISRYPDAAVIVGNGVIIDVHDRVTKTSYSKRYTLNALRYGRPVALQQSTFYRAEPFRAINGFNVENHTCWDGEILADFVLAGYSIKNIPDLTGAFRIYSSSITGSGRLFDQCQRDLSAIRRRALGRPETFWDRCVLQPAYIAYTYVSTPRRTLSVLADRIRRRLFRR